MAFAAPFTIAELLVSQLDGFTGAAELHLGGVLPDGRRPARPDGLEAGTALIAAAALLNQFGPLLDDDALVPLRARVAALSARFVQQYPEIDLALPGGDGPLAPAAAPAAASVKPPMAPPSIGLPNKGSRDLLFSKPAPSAPTAPQAAPSTAEPIAFAVADRVIAALEAYAAATALNLGDALADGSKLEAPSPDEAWRAILGGTALLNAFTLMMDEAIAIPYEMGYRHLIRRFGAQYPDRPVFIPGWMRARLEAFEAPVSSLVDVVEEAFAALRDARR